MKDKLDKKIRELVPSLMELSEGCELQYDNERAIIFDGNQMSAECGSIDNFDGIEDEDIIGHPIQLQHILLAIREAGNNRGYFIDVDGNIVEHPDSLAMNYNLSKSFNDQEEEVHKFLAEILNVK